MLEVGVGLSVAGYDSGEQLVVSGVHLAIESGQWLM